ncbi:MAG: 3-methyl-2-oxobutanoate hydroxymethyltransferase [Gammaproteobacteria bacterium]|nr:3-methyl-2-oxobutanoate hydroxymethyltransferase [Gammaproteobacteria bacterium]
MSAEKKPQKMSVTRLQAMKQAGEKIACLTAYDASFAKILDQAGVDLVLVGDSLGMVIQGHETTLPVTMDETVYHAQAVRRGLSQALLVVDLPFMSYVDPMSALHNAGRLLKESGAQMVKLEGGASQVQTVKLLAQKGIPVCAHLGLQPQAVHKLGGYRLQGKDDQSAAILLKDAVLLAEAGADLLILECVPELLASEITANVDIPVIGIGAGVGVDGQILVLYDLLGLSHNAPRFSKNFLLGHDSIQAAIAAYVAAVKVGSFPAPEQVLA